MMELETQRLRIDPFSKNDIEHWANIEADARVRKYIDGKPLTAEDAERYILRNIKSYKDNGFGRYAVRLLKDNTLIGMCGFLEEPYGIDFGYRFGHAYWQKGYATEAAGALVAYGHQALKMQHLVAWVHPENSASMHVLKKLNFEHLGQDFLYDMTVEKFQH